MALADNLVGYFAGEDATDSTGNTTLTNNNSVTFTAGKVGNAITCASASSQSLSAADNASLSMGDIDFTVACWALLNTSAATTQGLVSKWNDPASDREWFLGAFSSRFQFGVSNNGTAEQFIPANNLGAPSTGTWYFVVAWHDSVANTINICVNDGTVNSAAYSVGGRDGTATFRIGAYRNTAFGFLNGQVDEAMVWKRVITAAEITELYNAGAGRDYAYVSGAVAGQPMALRQSLFNTQPFGRGF